MQCTLMVPEAINEEVLADVLCKELQDSQLRGGVKRSGWKSLFIVSIQVWMVQVVLYIKSVIYL